MGTKIVKGSGGGIRGIADVKVGKTNYKVTMLDKGRRPSGDVFEIEGKAFPKAIKNGVYSVKLSAKGDKVFGIYPPDGTFVVRLKKFASKKDSVPVAWRDFRENVPSPKGGTYTVDKLKFSVVVNITEGTHEGLELPLTFDYKFGGDAEGKMQIVGSGRYAEQLVNFLLYNKFDFETDEISFSENVLPDLESLLTKRSRPNFMVTLKNGFLESLSPAPDLGKKKSATRRKVR